MNSVSCALDDRYMRLFKEMCEYHDLTEENMLRQCMRTTQSIDLEFEQGYDIQFVNRKTGETKPNEVFGCMGDYDD